MRGAFNLDGPIFTALSRLADLVILNLLFLLCCIPVITAGASMCALSYVLLKIRDEREGYIVRTFFRGFRQNFRQATVCWLIMLAAAGILAMDYRMINVMEGLGWMRVIVLFGALIWLMVLLYIFPLIARFLNSTPNMFRNALLIALANTPKTILMIATVIAAGFITFYNSTTIAYGLLVWFLVGFSLLGWFFIMLMYKMFERLVPEQAKEEKEDVWVVPEDDETAARSAAEHSMEHE